MQKFSATLKKRANLFEGGIAQMPAGITLTPQRWTARDIGGMDTATLSASGSLEDLGMLLTWVGDRAEIYNEMGTCVWWGVIYEIDANLGGIGVSVSLESVANKIAVRYSSYVAGGSTESATTDWVQDDASINRYGKRELLYSVPEAYSAVAESVRDRLLATYGDPAPVLRSQTDYNVGATIYCRGVWNMLDFSYFTNDKGLEEHADSGNEITLGAYYENNTISFTASDDIYDSANGLSALVNGTVFTVSGATVTGNNGTFTVQQLEDGGHLETIENTQQDETAATAGNVLIVIGEQTKADKLAMKFRNNASGTWNVAKIELYMARVGSPSDNVDVDFCADSAGSPGTVIESSTLVGNTIPNEIDWVTFNFTNANTLALATDYWIVVSRDGSASLANYYKFGTDEDMGYASGDMRIYNGSSWVAHSPDVDMPFRIVGEAYSTTQLATALETSTELTDVIVNTVSNMTVRIYRDNERTVKEEAEEMLGIGTSSGDRLIAWVTQDRAAIIATPPASAPTNPILGKEGKMRHASGTPWEPGVLVFGRWITVDGLPILDALSTKIRGSQAIYIERAEYDAQSDTLIVQSEGALDPWQVLRWTKG